MSALQRASTKVAFAPRLKPRRVSPLKRALQTSYIAPSPSRTTAGLVTLRASRVNAATIVRSCLSLWRARKSRYVTEAAMPSSSKRMPSDCSSALNCLGTLPTPNRRYKRVLRIFSSSNDLNSANPVCPGPPRICLWDSTPRRASARTSIRRRAEAGVRARRVPRDVCGRW